MVWLGYKQLLMGWAYNFSEHKMDTIKLIDTLKRLLNVDDDLSFLGKLDKKELETLIAYIREKLDNPPKFWC